LATAPKTARAIKTVQDLEGKTVGVSALANADHVLLVYLLKKAGVDPKRVQYATLGPNLYEALRTGQVDAGMVQEPALSLLKAAGGRELVNFMRLKDTQTYLGGPYEFMGVAIRLEERQARLEEMRRMARALEKALRFIHAASSRLIADTLPKELIAGGDRKELEEVIEAYRKELYPKSVQIDLEAARRVAESQVEAGLLPPGFKAESLLDLEVWVLRVQGLSLSYGPIRLLEGVDLEVGEGEFVAASRGLGYLLSFAQSTFNAALSLAILTLIVGFVLFLFAFFGRLEASLLRWQKG